jgi:hypothetical protein
MGKMPKASLLDSLIDPIKSATYHKGTYAIDLQQCPLSAFEGTISP